MLIPVNTDAPIYHFPAGTIGLIVVNVAAFLLTGAGFRPDLVDPWILWFGEIRPHQWLTAFFMHAGFMHLIGNMIFLWAFGLIVEGKLGWKRFIPLYLAIGISQCAVEQVIMLGSDREAMRQEQLDQIGLDVQMFDDVDPELDDADLDGEQGAFQELPVDPFADDFEEEELTDEELEDLERQLQFQSRRDQAILRILRKQPIMFGALGASGAIYSLLAMSLVWAPKNELTIVGLIGIRPVSFEITIMWFACFYIGLDFLVATLEGFSMSTAFLHTAGAVTGFVFGIALFKLRKVDCEDWDLFSVLSGNYGPHVRDIYGYRNEKGKKTKYSHQDEPKSKQKKSRVEKISDLVGEGDYVTAAEELFSLRMADPRARVPEKDLRTLGQGLVSEKDFEEAEPVLEDYIEAYPKKANWAVLRLAAIQLQVNQQPRASLETLRQINRETLTDKERAMGKKLSRTAKEQIQAGVEDRESEW